MSPRRIEVSGLNIRFFALKFKNEPISWVALLLMRVNQHDQSHIETCVSFAKKIPL